MDTSSILSYSESLGLALLGIVPIAPVKDTNYQAWLSSGKHGEMDWMKRSEEKRLNPQKVLGGAKSMVLVTLNYFLGDFPETIKNDPSRGLIARYAWYPEYHDVLKDKLEQLALFITEATGQRFQYKSYVDTGPVLERHWAQKAGLGFIGKNANLIFWKYGSYVFLGELLCDITLPEIHQTSIGGCGTCERCIHACPTGAIVRPNIIDSRLCISYLTIENKTSIPERLRPSLGNRIFGCDICQEICPWNSKAKKLAGVPEPDWNLWAPKLTGAVLLSEATFKKRYDRSPVLRAKHRGFIRNVAVALGNWGGADAKKALQSAQRIHRDPIVHEHISWAIAQCDKIQS